MLLKKHTLQSSPHHTTYHHITKHHTTCRTPKPHHSSNTTNHIIALAIHCRPYTPHVTLLTTNFTPHNTPHAIPHTSCPTCNTLLVTYHKVRRHMPHHTTAHTTQPARCPKSHSPEFVLAPRRQYQYFSSFPSDFSGNFRHVLPMRSPEVGEITQGYRRATPVTNNRGLLTRNPDYEQTGGY